MSSFQTQAFTVYGPFSSQAYSSLTHRGNLHTTYLIKTVWYEKTTTKYDIHKDFFFILIFSMISAKVWKTPQYNRYMIYEKYWYIAQPYTWYLLFWPIIYFNSINNAIIDNPTMIHYAHSIAYRLTSTTDQWSRLTSSEPKMTRLAV